MTTEIRTLRVSADMDANGYAAGAQKKVAADKAMGASGKEAAAGVKAVGDALAATDTKVSQAGNGIERLKRQYVTGYAASVDFERGLKTVGAGLDKGKLSAEQASLAVENLSRKYGQVANASEIAQRGQISLSQAISQANSRMAAQVTTADQAALAQRRMAAANQNVVGERGGDQGRRQNLTYQGFDIGQGLASGMPVGMIAAQQLPQIAQLYAGQGGLKAALSDVATLATGAAAAIGPIGIALGVTGAAAFAYYQLTKTESKTTDELLKAHQASIKQVGELWSVAAEERSKYGRVSTDVVTLGLENSISEMTKRLRKDVSSGAVGSGISSAINLNMDETGMNAGQFRQSSIYKQLKIDFDALHQATVAGRPDVFGLIQRLQDIRRNSDNTGIRQMAEDAVEALKPFQDLAEALREADMARRRLFEDRGDNGRLLSRGTTNTADAGNLSLYESRERIARERSQTAFDAQLAGLQARSPQERADAARQSAASQYNNDEAPAARRMRIEQAGTLALTQAEKALNEAREARARNLDKIVADQQLEISLIGKTAGEAAGLRREYELINQLKEEARQNGVSVDQKEIDRIKETTAELSKMADVLARAKMGEELKFERDQLGRSGIDQQIASRQRGAGLPVDLNSGEADQMREIERVKELREQGKGFITDLVSGLRNGEKIGETFGEAILDGLSRAADTQIDRLVDSLMSWAFPTAGGTSVASAGTGIAGAILGAANDNQPTGMAPVIPVTRAALPPTTEIGNYIAKAAEARGIDPSIALRVARSEGGLDSWNLQSNYVKNGVREPSFGPFQLYKGGGLGNKFMDRTGLDPANASAGPAGVDFALDEAKKSGWGAWYGAKKAGIGNFEGIDQTAKSVESLGTAASQAAQMTTGLGQTLASIPQALMANGGGSGILGGLTKYGMGIFSGSGQFASAMMRGGVGMYADGTDSAPGGFAMVGERGRELVNLPRGSQVVPNHKTEAMLSRAANNNGGSSQPPKIDLHVNVIGGSGDDHIRSLAEQGAQKVLGEYSIAQTRGGVGKTNAAYTARRA